MASFDQLKPSSSLEAWIARKRENHSYVDNLVPLTKCFFAFFFSFLSFFYNLAPATVIQWTLTEMWVIFSTFQTATNSKKKKDKKTFALGKKIGEPLNLKLFFALFLASCNKLSTRLASLRREKAWLARSLLIKGCRASGDARLSVSQKATRCSYPYRTSIRQHELTKIFAL